MLLAVGVGIGDADAVLGLLHFLDPRAGIHVDAALLEQAGQLLRNFLVFHGNHAGQELDDGDFGAEGAEQGAELHAHRARANDDQRLGHLLHGQDFDVGENAAVGLEAGQHFGLGAGGEDDVLGLDLADFAGRVAYLDGMHVALRRAGEPAKALEPGDLVLLHQEVETLGVLDDDGVFALEHRGPVERGRADAANAEVGGVLQMVPDFGVEEQGLGGGCSPHAGRCRPACRSSRSMRP